MYSITKKMIYDLEKNFFKKFNDNKIILTEKVNTKKLKYIVDNYESFFENFSKEEIQEWFKQDGDLTDMELYFNVEEKKRIYFNKLKKYLQRSRNGEIKIIYNQTKQKKGRYFCEGPSYQNHMRQFRHTLADEFYIDVDISNAHVVLLYQYCVKKNIHCEHLKEYATDRPKYLKMVSQMKGYTTKGSQKRYLLKMLNGGVRDTPKVKELIPLYEELKNIRETIYHRNSEIKKYVEKVLKEDCKNKHENIEDFRKCKKCWNIEGKVQNHLCCDLENQCLITMYNIFQSNGFYVAVLCFDGFMVRREEIEKKNINMDKLLRFTEEKVFETIGYKIDLTIKEMDEGFDIDPALYENIDVSQYELSLSDTEIDEYIEICVYGDNDDYADFFLELYGSNIKAYDYDTKKGLQYYHWNHSKALWEEQNSRSLMNHIKKIRPPFENKITDLQNEFKKMEKKTDEYNEMKEKIKYYKNALKKTKSASFVKGIITFIASRDLDEHINEYMNKSTYELPLKNKRVIDLRTQIVRDRTKDDFWSFELDVDFTDDSNEHIIKDYIKSLFKDPDTEKYISQLFGYMLSGSIKDRSFYVFHGVGSNGKSVLMDIYQNIITPHLYSTLSDQAILKQTNNTRGGATPDLICLETGRLAILNETNEGNEIDSALVKRLSGNDEITVRQLYKEPITFKTQNKILLISNHLPNFNCTDTAMLDRVKFIPFKQRFTNKKIIEEGQKVIEQLKTTLKSDVFSYFVRNFNEKLEPTEMMLEATKTYLKELNDVQTFVDEYFKIITKEEYDTSSKNEKKNMIFKCSELWIQYLEYHKRNGTNNRRKKEYTDILKSLGITPFKTNGINHYRLLQTEPFECDDIDDVIECEI